MAAPAATIKAALCTAYGGPDVIQIGAAPLPSPGDGEVLIRVRATTVSAADWRIRSATFPRGFSVPARLAFGWRRPRNPILGTECAGVIERAGRNVTRFREGDAVIAFTGAKFGCHAAFVKMPADAAIVAKPDAMPFDEAAVLSFGGTTALHFLVQKAAVQAGERVLIIGATGAVGSAAVQIARQRGAHVTAVCSAANIDLARRLGADDVIDYTRTDIASTGQSFDVILDIAGTLPPKQGLALLAPGGRLALISAGLSDTLAALARPSRQGRRLFAGPAPERREDLETLLALAQSGAYRPLIDSRFPFVEIAAAHARVGTGRKTGSVVMTFDAP